GCAGVDGGAGKACASGQVCAAGACAASCLASETLCNGLCTNTLTDPANCGGCAGVDGGAGMACASGQVCAAGACTASCLAGETLCNGLCTNTNTDPLNCGGCAGVDGGVACGSGQVCAAGACAASCLAGETLCNGLCTNTNTDPLNCGGCAGPGGAGVACPSGQTCNGAGACTETCASGYSVCGSGATAYCANLQQDPLNCGICNTVCGTGEVCRGGLCSACPFNGTVGATWTTLTSLPAADNPGGAPGFSDLSPAGSGAFYSLEGTDLAVYQIGSNSWTTLAAAPAVLSGSLWPGAAWVGNGLYVIYGGDVLEYNVATNVWTTLLTGLAATQFNETTHDGSGNVYTVDSAGKVLKYVIASNTASELTPSVPFGSLSEPHTTFDGCSGLLYVTPFYSGASLYSFDPATSASKQLASIPDPQISDAFCGDGSGHLYAAGAADGQQFWQYTIASDSWVKIATPPFNVANCGACTVGSDGYLYFTSGPCTNAPGPLARIQLQ
ncbi:MAG: hypothetical protein ACYDCL_07610, partial [Myxococcales bacterium]